MNKDVILLQPSHTVFGCAGFMGFAMGDVPPSWASVSGRGNQVTRPTRAVHVMHVWLRVLCFQSGVTVHVEWWGQMAG